MFANARVELKLHPPITAAKARSVLLTVKMFAGGEEFRQAYDSKCVSVHSLKGKRADR
jgi:hypothetical protein